MKCIVKRHEVVQPQDKSIKLIPLTKGQNAIVDAWQYDHLMQWNWTACWNPKTNSFYAYRKASKQEGRGNILMHRVVLNAPHGVEVDHKSRSATLDNRECNLRLASDSLNSANHRRRSDNTSGYIGVSYRSDCRNHWIAEVWVYKEGKSRKIAVGNFATAEDAARARDLEAIRQFGEFAHLNFQPSL